MNEYDKQWSKRRRGPYETADGVRFVVAPNRSGVTVLCPMCGARVHPGSLVAEVGGETLCMGCRPPGGSRIRAGMRRNRERPQLLGFMLNNASLWRVAGGRVWIFAQGSAPVGETLHQSHERIGSLLRTKGVWNGSLVVRWQIGEVELLVPIKLENLGTLEMMPGELYFREVANSLLHLRLKDREAFRRSQLAARMRLWAWNKGEK